MVMVEATLATELENLTPTFTEAAAITVLTDAYGVYSSDATALTPILSTGIALGKAAMAVALIGMSAPGAGIAIIPAAIAAFWVAVAGGLATSFAGATAIVPPPHATLPATFAALMPANTAANVTLEQAAATMAMIMHTDAIVGGTVTTPPSVVTPIL